MGRETVARADRALLDMGLLDCNLIPQEPPDGWFQKRRETGHGGHWRHDYTSWTKYVPRPGCRMSLLTICAWSYLAHCAQTGWTPRNGLGASYLCRILRANRLSVQRVLGTLRQCGLIRRHDGSWCPVLVDLDWLADKWDGAKPKEGTSKVQWVELPAGTVATIPTDDSTCAASPAPGPEDDNCGVELFTRLMRCPNLPETERRKAIGKSVITAPAWREDERACFLEISHALDFCQPGREWDLVAEWVRLHGNGEA
jgi:hypothetical protein